VNAPLPAPVDRRAARVLLVDAHGRVLLFRGHDPARPGAGSWWFTVGGGLDEGESHRDAALRELTEETGLVVSPEALRGPVHNEVAEFSLGGTSYRQDNEFFVVEVDRHDVMTEGFSAFEDVFVLEHRWWSRTELRSTSDVVYPETLADLLDRLGV
jgi:8-oxo-dGTP pyrophosphatase MutT (NUDIX family)